MDLDLAKMLQTCLSKEVWFQTFSLFKPKPPSFLGKHKSDQETLAFAAPSSFPFQINLLNFYSIALRIFLGEMEIPIQYTCKLYSTKDSGWSLPA